MPASSVLVRHPVVLEACKFALVGVSNTLLSLAVYSLLVWALVSAGGVEKVAGYVVTVAAVTGGTFLANRRWAFAA
jgi:putative flippase GtrA